jgi:NTP pyrophosphatase (non-canonical NTP hydrolase)
VKTHIQNWEYSNVGMILGVQSVISNNGLAKVIEECGELIQVCAKRIASNKFETNDSQKLDKIIEEEIADVLASTEFLIAHLKLNKDNIKSRSISKLKTYNYKH